MLRFAWLAMAGLLWIAPTIAQTAFTPRDESPQDSPRVWAAMKRSMPAPPATVSSWWRSNAWRVRSGNQPDDPPPQHAAR